MTVHAPWESTSRLRGCSRFHFQWTSRAARATNSLSPFLGERAGERGEQRAASGAVVHLPAAPDLLLLFSVMRVGTVAKRFLRAIGQRGQCVAQKLSIRRQAHGAVIVSWLARCVNVDSLRGIECDCGRVFLRVH